MSPVRMPGPRVALACLACPEFCPEAEKGRHVRFPGQPALCPVRSFSDSRATRAHSAAPPEPASFRASLRPLLEERRPTTAGPRLAGTSKIPESATGHCPGFSLGYRLVRSPMPLDLASRSVSPVCSGLCASCADLPCPSVTGSIHKTRQLHQEPEGFSGMDV